MSKKIYERASAELINIASEKTLFTASTTDLDNNDGEPGWYWDEDACDNYCDDSYCDAIEEGGGGWVEC